MAWYSGGTRFESVLGNRAAQEIIVMFYILSRRISEFTRDGQKESLEI
jgi:hypothetical protein